MELSPLALAMGGTPGMQVFSKTNSLFLSPPLKSRALGPFPQEGFSPPGGFLSPQEGVSPQEGFSPPRRVSGPICNVKYPPCPWVVRQLGRVTLDRCPGHCAPVRCNKGMGCAYFEGDRICLPRATVQG